MEVNLIANNPIISQLPGHKEPKKEEPKAEEGEHAAHPRTRVPEQVTGLILDAEV